MACECKTERQVADAIAAGGRVLTGGKSLEREAEVSALLRPLDGCPMFAPA